MVQKDPFPKITDQEMDRLRRVMNVELEARDPFNRYASPDTIRHFAHAIGDDNPLFTDEDYAASTRWGCPVAPPTFLFSCFGRGAPQGLRGFIACGAALLSRCMRRLLLERALLEWWRLRV